MKRSVIAVSLVLAIHGYAIGQEDTKPWKHPDPITYESLRTWHAEGGLKGYPWQREWHLDLNNERVDEVFLGIEGYSRGMGYSVFTHTPAGWQMIAQRVEGSNHPFEILPQKHGAWHDFMSVLPSGRGGVFEFVYTWDGKKYIEKSEREVTSKELSHQ
jgi:hypothetical protein